VISSEFSTPNINEIRPKVIVIAGPTASGKSELAVRLAERFDGEVINADSMQIYSEMFIGTARPCADMLERVPHHLFGIIPPDKDFTAADFQREARGVITDIASRGKLPVISGGTGLYIRVLLGGLAESPSADNQYRQELNEFAAACGTQALHERLQAVDPETAGRLHPNDSLRVIRALEVFKQTGRSMSELQHEHKFMLKWCNSLKIGIKVERKELYSRINERVDRMIADGLVKEVERLLSRGYSPRLKSLSSIGYKEICEYLSGRVTLSEAIGNIQKNSRHYAKRQLTWFGSDMEMNWFEFPLIFEDISAYVTDFLRD
jgi:tRNA dimethylallyltransferase